jgi:hypothetical protein
MRKSRFTSEPKERKRLNKVNIVQASMIPFAGIVLSTKDASRGAGSVHELNSFHTVQVPPSVNGDMLYTGHPPNQHGFLLKLRRIISFHGSFLAE